MKSAGFNLGPGFICNLLWLSGIDSWPFIAQSLSKKDGYDTIEFTLALLPPRQRGSKLPMTILSNGLIDAIKTNQVHCTLGLQYFDSTRRNNPREPISIERNLTQDDIASTRSITNSEYRWVELSIDTPSVDEMMLTPFCSITVARVHNTAKQKKISATPPPR